MMIPHERLAPETLRNVVESFVTREGTDYGAREYSLEAKIDQVLRQIFAGEAVLVFDEASESCDIVQASRR